MGIFLGSRTGLCQGIDDGVRKKIALLGLPLSRRTFVVADHCLHTLPALVLVGTLVRRRERIPRIVSVYAIMLASWFLVPTAPMSVVSSIVRICSALTQLPDTGPCRFDGCVRCCRWLPELLWPRCCI